MRLCRWAGKDYAGRGCDSPGVGSMNCLSPQAHLLRTYHIVTCASASMALLRAFLSRRWRGMRLLTLLRRSRPLLLVPLIELLLLLLFLLLVTLLHRRGRTNQRMRLRSRSHLLWRSRSHLLRLRRPEVAIRRLNIAILLRGQVSILRLLHTAILGLRSSLLLVGARLRLGHLLDLTAAAVRLSKWPEA